jgi:bifunctional ADP-heptose synthase (sugar kinase/adenylyltransferase)
VSLLSVIGTDEAGTRLRRLLGKERVAARLHRDRSIATTIKLRVIGRQQQLLRVDFERTPRSSSESRHRRRPGDRRGG